MKDVRFDVLDKNTKHIGEGVGYVSLRLENSVWRVRPVCLKLAESFIVTSKQECCCSLHNKLIPEIFAVARISGPYESIQTSLCVVRNSTLYGIPHCTEFSTYICGNRTSWWSTCCLHNCQCSMWLEALAPLWQAWLAEEIHLTELRVRADSPLYA